MERMSNREIAILQKANELAERYGFKPTDLVITYGPASTKSSEVLLWYETPPPEGKEEQFDKMIASLGIDPGSKDEPQLRGTDDEQIYDALVAAIKKAPRARSR